MHQEVTRLGSMLQSKLGSSQDVSSTPAVQYNRQKDGQQGAAIEPSRLFVSACHTAYPAIAARAWPFSLQGSWMAVSNQAHDRRIIFGILLGAVIVIVILAIWPETTQPPWGAFPLGQ